MRSFIKFDISGKLTLHLDSQDSKPSMNTLLKLVTDQWVGNSSVMKITSRTTATELRVSIML